MRELNDVELDAVIKGTLPDVQNMVESQYIDFTQLSSDSQAAMFIRLFQDDTIPQRIEKIIYLIESGAVPPCDNDFNLLYHACVLQNKDLLKLVVGFIKNSATLIEYYDVHLQACDGKLPDSAELTVKEDKFGFYPICYAIVIGIDISSWYQRFTYDIVKPIGVKNGLFHGINLAYFLLLHERVNDFLELLKGVNNEQLAAVFETKLLNEHNIFYDISAASLLIGHDRRPDVRPWWEWKDFLQIAGKLTCDQITVLFLQTITSFYLAHNGIVVQGKFKVIDKLLQTNPYFFSLLLERYEYDKLYHLYNEFDEESLASWLISLMLFKKVYNFIKDELSKSIESEEQTRVLEYIWVLFILREDIESNILRYDDDVELQKKLLKELDESLGLLIGQASKTIYAAGFYRQLGTREEVISIESAVPGYALKGYAYYLKVLGAVNEDKVKVLVIEHAQLEKQRDDLARELEKVKIENAIMQADIVQLKVQLASSQTQKRRRNENKKGLRFFEECATYSFSSPTGHFSPSLAIDAKEIPAGLIDGEVKFDDQNKRTRVGKGETLLSNRKH